MTVRSGLAWGLVAVALSAWVALGWTAVAEPLATPEALLRGLQAVAVAAVGWAAVLGGGRVLRQVLNTHLGEDDWIHDIPAGFLAALLLLAPLALAHDFTPLASGLAALILLCGWLIPSLGRPPRRTWVSPAVVVAVLALLTPAAIEALAPPTHTDELSWHLAVSAQLLDRGLSIGGWTDPIASRPLPLHLLYAGLLAAGGESAPRLFHLGGCGLLLMGIYTLTRRHGPADRPARAALGGAWAVALVAGSWTFLSEAGLAMNDLPTALMVLAALEAALAGRRRRIGLALAAGSALALKYSAAPAVVVIYLLYARTRLHEPSPRPWPTRLAWLTGELGLLTAGALLLVVPWWIRNLTQELHPLFPFAGWPADAGFTFVYLDKYGAGRGWVDLLWLPWRLVFDAETRSFVFLGRVHPMWLASLPVVLWAAWRDPTTRAVGLAGAASVLGWWLGPQWMRHLLPLSPLLAVPCGLAMARAHPRMLAFAAGGWLLLLPPQLTDSLTRAAEALPAATGAVSRGEWYTEQVPAWPAIAWVNTYTPPRARVALLFTGELALVEREVHLGSVEDHTPSRWWVHTHGDQALEALRDEGITHVVVGRVHFLRSSYRFLDDTTFQRRFRGLEEQLRSQLLQEATLVFEDGRHSVWEL